MDFSDLKADCAYFNGEHPCTPNILQGTTCDDCNHYKKIGKRILIIKLGAMGDVIRTTPLIRKYMEVYPNCQITWLTNFPELILNNDFIISLKYNFESVLLVESMNYDIAVNLEKDVYVASLFNKVTAKHKYGFACKNNVITPVNELAYHKYLTGVDSNYSKQNIKSYLTETFDICGFSYKGEELIINRDNSSEERWKVIFEKSRNQKSILVLNTGTGLKWPTRIWPVEYFVELIRQVKDLFFVVVVGGPIEEQRNIYIAETENVYYPGVLEIPEYTGLLSNANVVITSVTMTFHLAAALSKRIILFNTIFNKNEFLDYPNVQIIEPKTFCDCYYGTTCTREKSCIYDISVSTVLSVLKNEIYE